MSLRIPIHAVRDPWTMPPPAQPDRLRPWLTDRESLTARITARCRRFRVQVLRQELAVPHADEAAVLQVRRGSRVWLREVLLVADDVPVVYARSMVPQGSRWRLFSRIGNRSLGHTLFADPRVLRGPLTARRLDARERRYHRAVAVANGQQPLALWARRSLFARGRERLLVCEVFLASILNLTEGCLKKPLVSK